MVMGGVAVRCPSTRRSAVAGWREGVVWQASDCLQSRGHVVLLAFLLFLQNHMPIRLRAILDGTLKVDLGDVLNILVSGNENPVDHGLLA